MKNILKDLDAVDIILISIALYGIYLLLKFYGMI